MPKLKNQFILVARDSTIDTNDHMQSVNKIIDIFTFGVIKEDFNSQLTSSQSGVVELNTSPFVLLTNWRFDKKNPKDFSGSILIEIKTPDSKTTTPGDPFQFEVPSEQIGFNLNINFQSLPVSIEGEYSVMASILDASGKTIASAVYGFTVVITDSNT